MNFKLSAKLNELEMWLKTVKLVSNQEDMGDM